MRWFVSRSGGSFKQRVFTSRDTISRARRQAESKTELASYVDGRRIRLTDEDATACRHRMHRRTELAAGELGLSACNGSMNAD